MSSRPSEARAGTHNHRTALRKRAVAPTFAKLTMAVMGPCFRRHDSGDVAPLRAKHSHVITPAGSLLRAGDEPSRLAKSLAVDAGRQCRRVRRRLPAQDR